MATLASEAFAPLGQRVAKALGFPCLPLVLVPHPMDFRTAEECERIARGIVDEICHVLTQPSDKLAAEYEERFLQTGPRLPVRSSVPI